MSFEPTLSPRFAVYIQNYLLSINVDPETLFSSCDIRYPFSNNQNMTLPVSKFANLLEKTARQINNPYVGLHLVQRYRYEAAGIMTLTVLAAPNVEEGIKALCHYDQYIDPAIEVSLDIGPKASALKINLINPKNVVTVQLTELLLIMIVDILNKGTGQRMPVTEVWFSHSGNKKVAPLEDFFGARVNYDQIGSQVFFDNSFLKKSFITSNDLLFDILKNSLENYLNTYEKDSSFLGMVCREIIRQTTDVTPNIRKVSLSMGMSERTLRRRLADKGIRFQEAKNMAREKRAQYHLAHSNMSLTEIAFELGFSELSGFSRAFRHWVGETPQAYRKRLKKM